MCTNRRREESWANAWEYIYIYVYKLLVEMAGRRDVYKSKTARWLYVYVQHGFEYEYIRIYQEKLVQLEVRSEGEEEELGVPGAERAGVEWASSPWVGFHVRFL